MKKIERWNCTRLDVLPKYSSKFRHRDADSESKGYFLTLSHCRACIKVTSLFVRSFFLSRVKLTVKRAPVFNTKQFKYHSFDAPVHFFILFSVVSWVLLYMVGQMYHACLYVWEQKDGTFYLGVPSSNARCFEVVRTTLHKMKSVFLLSFSIQNDKN